MTYFSKKIRDTRIDNDSTQEQMANILGIARSRYKNYEIERNMMPLFIIVKFANHFNLSLDFLFNLSNKKYCNSNINYNNDLSAKLIKQIRQEKNLSQEKFGKILGLPQRTYSSYENNERTLTIEILLKIAKITHYSLDYLTGRVNN